VSLSVNPFLACTMDSSLNNDNIEIVQLEEKYFAEAVEVLNQGFGTKRCCICVSGVKGVRQFRQSHTAKPLKREIAFLAIDKRTNTILGVVQLSKPGVPAFFGMHTCAPNEVYIDQLGVAEDARGRGVGTKLLEFCENFARNEPGIEILTLDVLKGNKALSLYERFGFEIVPFSNACERGMWTFMVTLFVGRPYGWCNPEWGLHNMKKKLI